MNNIKAGIVVVNKYCKAQSRIFSGYIEYMDRDEAIRQESFPEFNLFNDYMGNPEKSSGLFINGKTALKKNEIEELKELFKKAQDNGSYMWQTVLSFDNRWLEENGLYDSEQQILNEYKIKELATNGINRMLKNEKLEHALWSASIHYNTDNIHVHVATVEVEPMREKKKYKQFTYKKNEKNRLVKNNEILDLNGNPVYKEEIKGKFDKKSFEVCKQYIVQQVLKEKNLNAQINQILREKLVRTVNSSIGANDKILMKELLQLHKEMPDCKRSLWKYNTNIMLPYQNRIDAIADRFLQRNFPGELEELRDLLKRQSEMYRTAYGESKAGRDFEESKLKELHMRMGNSILTALRKIDKSGIIESGENWPETSESTSKIFEREETYADAISDIELLALGENIPKNFESVPAVQISTSKIVNDVYVKWEYKKEKKIINDYLMHPKQEQREEVLKAFEKIEALAQSGNVIAAYDIGNLYKNEKVIKGNEVRSNEYFLVARKGYTHILKNMESYVARNYPAIKAEKLENQKKFLQDYLNFRLGQMNNYGIGGEENSSVAAQHFEKSDMSFAKYALGQLYYEGNGVEQNYELAAENYKKALTYDTVSPYAAYKLGVMYESGIYFSRNHTEAYQYFEQALQMFEGLDDDSDMHIKYRIGYMHLHGLGTEEDKIKAFSYFKEAESLGNQNAKYQLGCLYADQEFESYNLQKGIHYLKEVAEKGNEYAEYRLGCVYTNEELPVYDLQKGMQYLELAVEKGNEYAEYRLGCVYINEELSVYDLQKGMQYLELAVEKGNEYAEYRLGRLYTNKEFPVYDFQKGMALLTKLSKNGNSYATSAIGDIYRYQLGNRNEALRWYQNAGEQGSTYAKTQIIKMAMGTTNQTVRKNFEIEKALRALKKSLQRDYKSWKNIFEHDAELQRKLEKEKTQDSEIQ